MGIFALYVRLIRARYTGDLDHSGELRVQVRQSALQLLAVARVLGSFKLLKHALARQEQALSPAFARDLTGRHDRLRRARCRYDFCLLLLDRLALPASRHLEIILVRALVPNF